MIIWSLPAQDHTAKVWRTSDGKLLAELNHSGQVEHSEFSPDNDLIISSSEEATKIWLTSSIPLATPEASEQAPSPIFPVGIKHDGPSVFSTFSPNGSMMLAVGTNVVKMCWTSSLYQGIGEHQHEMVAELDRLENSQNADEVKLQKLQRQFNQMSKRLKRHQNNKNAHQ